MPTNSAVRCRSLLGRAPDGVLAIFEVFAEGLPPDKPQDDLVNQLIQIEGERGIVSIS